MIVKATDSHILHVCRHIRADDRRELLLTQWGDDLNSISGAPGVRYAVLRNGFPASVFGVVPLFPGVGQAWLIGTDEIGKCGVEVAHACKKIIDALLDSGVHHRIQAFSADFHTQAHTWLKLIGFEQESTLRKFGKDGSDFYCFATVR